MGKSKSTWRQFLLSQAVGACSVPWQPLGLKAASYFTSLLLKELICDMDGKEDKSSSICYTGPVCVLDDVCEGLGDPQQEELGKIMEVTAPQDVHPDLGGRFRFTYLCYTVLHYILGRNCL